MQAEIIKISGMSCDHCIKSVENAVKKLPVEKHEVKMGSLYVEYDPLKVFKEQIVLSIEDSGYEVIQ